MTKEIVAWDSCIIIDAIAKTPDRYPAIAPMIRRAESEELSIVVSSASVAEVLYLPGFQAVGKTQEEQNDLIEKWFDNSYLVKRNVDFGVGLKAAELRRQFQGLTPVDSIILATALLHEADTLVTYDETDEGGKVGLLKLQGKLRNSSLRIAKPENYSPQTEIPID